MRMPVTSGASEILKQQRQRIARIQAQNAELTHELVQDSKAQRLLSNKMLSKDVQQSKTDIEQYLRKVRLEELVIKDTTSTISTLTKRLRNQSRAKGGEIITEHNNKLIQKQTNILQKRLEHAAAKYNAVIEKNTKLRTQIDTLVHKREIYDKIFTRIGAEIALISDESARLAYQIEQVECEREKVTESMTKIMEDAQKQSRKFDDQVVNDSESRKRERQRIAREKIRVQATVIPDTKVSVNEPEAEEKDNVHVGGLNQVQEADLHAAHTTGKWTSLAKKTLIGQSKDHLHEANRFFDQVGTYF